MIEVTPLRRESVVCFGMPEPYKLIKLKSPQSPEYATYFAYKLLKFHMVHFNTPDSAYPTSQLFIMNKMTRIQPRHR